MKKLSSFIIQYRFFLLALFAVCIIVSCIFIPKTVINNDITKYLPKGAPSVEAMQKITDAFGGQTSTHIMVEDITQAQADKIGEDLKNVDGINSVTIKFKDDTALFAVNMDYYGYSTEAREVVDEIRVVLSPYSVYLAGDVISSTYMDEIMDRNMPVILIISCIVILIILIATSTSWVDPIVFGIILGGAIAINLGTNALLHDVSFITNAICVVMQLALAMDYSIMLLHRFNEEKQKTPDVKNALTNALTRTFGLVSSGSLTTVAGLVALMFMQFTIGFDVGLVLAKGAIISMLCVFLFMPGVILLFHKLLEKTKHRSLHIIFLNSINKRYNNKHSYVDSRFAESVMSDHEPQYIKPKKVFTYANFQKATRVIVPCIVLLLIVAGTYLQQANLQYTYSIDTATDKDATINVSTKKIQEKFGIQNTIVVMVPKGDYEKEQLILDYMQVENKDITTSSFTFVGTGLTRLYTAAELASEYEIPNFVVTGVFELMQKDTATDSVMLIDFLKTASTSQYVKTYLEPLQQTIDTLYQRISELHVELDAYEFATKYNLDPAYAEIVWDYLSQTYNTTLPQDHVIYHIVTTNSLFMSAFMTLPVQVQFVSLFTLYQFSILTIPDLENILASGTIPFLPPEYAEALLNTITELNLPPVADVYELFEYFSINQTIATLATELQQEIDIAYAGAKTAQEMFESTYYSRLVFNINLATSSPEAFALTESLRKHVATIYPENYIAGGTPTMYDIADTFNRDAPVITLIAFLAILIIILITFKSFSISVLLTVLIQGAIFITMGSNALFGAPIFFICYLLVMCIQMGATIDYAILIASRYTEARATHNKYQSAAIALERSLTTILTSGLILTLSSFSIGFVSEVALIAAFGQLLGLGCLISMTVVIFALPQILILCDKVIKKTTYKANFCENTEAPPLFLNYQHAEKPKRTKK